MTNRQAVLIAAAISYNREPYGMSFVEWLKVVTDAMEAVNG